MISRKRLLEDIEEWKSRISDPVYSDVIRSVADVIITKIKSQPQIMSEPVQVSGDEWVEHMLKKFLKGE